MATFDTWESYFYPPPDNGTLRNLEDIRDPVALRTFEYGAVAWRHRQLCDDPSVVSHTFDAAHVRAIHRYLFQDVYEWAGEYRSVNMAKNLSSFADAHTGEIDRYLADVHHLVGTADWGSLDRDAFARASAEVFAYVNQAHPFREGNGRASKVFMEHVAEQSGFTLDFAHVDPQAWNLASMWSGPDRGSYEPVSHSLVPVFQAIVRPRPPALARGAQRVDQERTPANGRAATRRSLGAEIERRLAERPRRPEGGEPPAMGRGRR